MLRANRHIVQWAVFSVAYSCTSKTGASAKGAYSLHLTESSAMVRRTKSTGARLRDVGKLNFKWKLKRSSDIQQV
jgi:hypothetical protein